MRDGTPIDLRRVGRYVALTTAVAVVVGVLRQGSLVGGLLFGLAIGVGAAVGLLAFEVASRR